MIKLLIPLIILTFLVGCTKTEVVTLQTPVVCTSFQKPDPIVTRKVEIHPVQDQEGIWWIAVDAQSYGNLAINNSAMLQFIIQQKSVINYLQGCIERHNRGIPQ